MPATPPPNFLFFITDQQRWDHVGYAGNSILATPHIDSIAAGGSWFSRFYVASPTCMSNRAAFMTGRIPRVNGVRYNGIPLNLDAVTFVDLLRAAGYRTALIGKSHIQGMTSEPAKAPREAFAAGLRAPPPELAEAMRSRYSRADYTVEMGLGRDRSDHARSEYARPERTRSEQCRPEQCRSEQGRSERTRSEPGRSELGQRQDGKPEQVRSGHTRSERSRQERFESPASASGAASVGAQPARLRTPYYGFEDVAFCLGHGDRVTGHYTAWLERKAPGMAAKLGPDSARAVSEVAAAQVYLPAIPAALYPTRFVEEETIAWLERHAGGGDDRGGSRAGGAGRAPFFLQCSFPDPHHPFTPPGRYYSMYDPDEVVLPPSFYTPTRNATPPLARLWEEYERGVESPRWTWPFVTGERQARDILAKTYGQIGMIDDAVGAVLAALERLGLAGNTVVCFLSDHGEYLGDHGLMLKGPMQYQSIVRTPFAWRDPDPDLNRGRIDDLGSTLDLARTVLSRAGLAPYNGIQGVDLCPLLAGEAASRDHVLVEYTTQYPYLGLDDLVTVSTLIDRRWRLSVWQNRDWGELHDLAADPHELNNLWADPDAAQVRESLLVRLVHAIQNHADTSPYPLSVS